MWKNMVQPDRSHDNIMRRMRFECWKTKATNIHTHSEYLILTAIPQQQYLRERASILRSYVHCLSCSSLFYFKWDTPTNGIEFLLLPSLRKFSLLSKTMTPRDWLPYTPFINALSKSATQTFISPEQSVWSRNTTCAERSNIISTSPPA